MWARMTKEELQYAQRETRRRRLRFSGFIFFVTLIVTIIGNKIGINGGIAHTPLNWPELMYTLPDLMIMAFVTGVICYLLPIEKLTPDARNFQMTVGCLKCEKTTNMTRETICTCGGELVDISQLRWDDSEKS